MFLKQCIAKVIEVIIVSFGYLGRLVWRGGMKREWVYYKSAAVFLNILNLSLVYFGKQC